MCFVCILTTKSKRVHVPKYTHFSDHWLRTSAVIRVYKARARRNGTGSLFQFTYCDVVTFDFKGSLVRCFVSGSTD